MESTTAELKSKHQQALDTIGLIIEKLIPLGITHQHTEDEVFDGRTVRIKGHDLVNFSSCSYLGLELDPRLKQGAIDAINRYGTYFSSSRAYLTTGLYEEIESLLAKMFERPILLSTSTMLGHVSNIPVLVDARPGLVDCVLFLVREYQTVILEEDAELPQRHIFAFSYMTHESTY